MSLQQLRYFVETARTLHFTKAAKNLNVSQPSLSYAISQLSKRLGVPLFKREGAKVTLTEYGEAFLPYVENALNILAQGEAQISRMQLHSTGSINLGCIYSVSFDVIPQLINNFYIYRGNSDISFKFQVNMTNILVERLIEGELDVVMAPYPKNLNDCIESIPIFEQELYLVVHKNHPLVSHRAVTIEDFKNEMFIMINKETDLFQKTISLFEEHNINPRVFSEVYDCNSMASFVGAQLGIAIMPKMPSFDSFEITAIPFRDKTVTRTISLLWNNKIKPNRALKSFLDYCHSLNKNKGTRKKTLYRELGATK